MYLMAFRIIFLERIFLTKLRFLHSNYYQGFSGQKPASPTSLVDLTHKVCFTSKMGHILANMGVCGYTIMANKQWIFALLILCWIYQKA